MNRKEYLKKWREDNKEHIQNYKEEYAKTHDSSFKKLQDKYKQLQQENQQLKNNWNKLKEWLYEDHYLYVPEIAINSTYQVVLNKMQELEQGSDSNVKD